jgi:hypothetical protein
VPEPGSTDGAPPTPRRGPLWRRVIRRTAQAVAGVVLLLVIAYAWLAFRFFTGTPNVAVDYVARLNEPIEGLADDERAWPVYREAFLSLDPHDLGVVREHGAAWPGDPAWSAVEPILPAARPVLDRLSELASTRPAMGLPIGVAADAALVARGVGSQHDPPGPDVPLATAAWQTNEAVSVLRPLARLLALDARNALGDDDDARAERRIRALVTLAGHARDSRTTVDQLVSLACLGLTVDTVERAIHQGMIDGPDERLAALAGALSAYDDNGFVADFDIERWTMLDLVQRTYSDDGSGNGRLVHEGLGTVASLTRPGSRAEPSLRGPIVARVLVDRRTMESDIERIFTILRRNAQRPPWRRGPESLEGEIQRLEDGVSRFRRAPLLVFLPALGRVQPGHDRARLGRDSALAAIALARHRLRNGTFPDTLDTLVPDLLPALPIDPHSGDPLRYELRDGQPTLWSVGENGVDDGGEGPHFLTRVAPRDRGRGDLRLWPPEPREPVEIEPFGDGE